MTARHHHARPPQRSDEAHALGRPGGDWHGLRPTFDNPFTWSVAIARIGGLSVRVHALFLLFIVIMLLSAKVGPIKNQSTASVDLTIMSVAMACLFMVVLAHELGHALVCRLMGGVADEVLLWPLGGLAWCQLPLGTAWRAHLAVACAGPVVNLLLCVLAGGMLGALTGQWMGVAVPNVLWGGGRPFEGLLEIEIGSWAHYALYLVNETSLILLLFNLLPMFPFDGARILQALLWPVQGYSRSMRNTVRAGYIAAIALALYGWVVGPWALVVIAVFGVFVCINTQRQVEWSDQMLDRSGDEPDLSALEQPDDAELEIASAAVGGTGKDRPPGARPALPKDQDMVEVDRILQKIGERGIESLTKAERDLLKRATERRRSDPVPGGNNE